MKTMNSTDSQILTGAIELLAVKGQEQRISKLEADNKKLIGMINTISAILSHVADTSDPVVCRLLQGLDLSIGLFR